MTDKSEELKPCPFCGSGAMLWASQNNGRKYYVECGDCRNRTYLESTRAKAIAAWNTRIEGKDT